MKAKVNWKQVERTIKEMRNIDRDEADHVLDMIERKQDWYNRKGWTTEQVVARVVNLTEQRARRISHETGYFV